MSLLGVYCRYYPSSSLSTFSVLSYNEYIRSNGRLRIKTALQDCGSRVGIKSQNVYFLLYLIKESSLCRGVQSALLASSINTA